MMVVISSGRRVGQKLVPKLGIRVKPHKPKKEEITDLMYAEELAPYYLRLVEERHDTLLVLSHSVGPLLLFRGVPYVLVELRSDTASVQARRTRRRRSSPDAERRDTLDLAHPL